MDCVFHAYTNHLAYLGIKFTQFDYVYYRWFKWATGDAYKFTYGGLVPSLIQTLAKKHNLKVVIQNSLLDKAFYVANVMQHETNLLKQWIVKHSDFGEQVSIVTIEPAVYLPLPTMPHAFFSRIIPDVGITMALQLRRQ